MSKSVARVRTALEAAGLAADIIRTPESTRTAAEAAAVAGCALDQIVKSIVFAGARTGDVLLFLTAGGNRVDETAAARLAGEPLARADAALVRARTGFVIGGVAPLGHLSPVRCFWDARLDAFPQVWAAAGTPNHIFPIVPADLRRVAGAVPGAFTA